MLFVGGNLLPQRAKEQRNVRINSNLHWLGVFVGGNLLPQKNKKNVRINSNLHGLGVFVGVIYCLHGVGVFVGGNLLPQKSKRNVRMNSNLLYFITTLSYQFDRLYHALSLYISF